jgi:hypothetical protein
VIVVDLLGIRRAADRADPALLGKQLLDVLLPDPVPLPKVVLAGTAIEPLFALAAPLVVTWLAVARVSRDVRPVTWKVVERLDAVAVRAVTVPVRNFTRILDDTSILLRDTLRIAQLRSLVEARFAVTPTPTLSRGLT